LEYSFAGPSIPYLYEFIKIRYGNGNLVIIHSSYPKLTSTIEKDLGPEKFANNLEFPSKEVFQRGADEKD